MRKSARKHGQELVKPVIAIPSFRLVPDYEDRQQEVEKRKKFDMQQQLVPSTHEVILLNLGGFQLFYIVWPAPECFQYFISFLTQDCCSW